MFRFFLAAALAAAVFACASAPALQPTPTPTPASATSTPSPASSPSATPIPIPSGALAPAPWEWEPQGPDPQLDQVLADLPDPVAVSAFLRARTRWTDAYDLRRFFAPSVFLAQGWGSCTAFARFWARWAAQHGAPVHFVAFWAPPDRAHAVAVFRWPAAAGPWRMASNQWAFMSPEQQLAPHLGGDRLRRAAYAYAASDHYASDWTRLDVYREPDGALVERWALDAVTYP